jgi:signal transduction histidine kinase
MQQQFVVMAAIMQTLDQTCAPSPIAPIISAKKKTTRKSRRTAESNRLAVLAHDARNLLATLQLYCDLLAEPGVLAEGREYFAAELRMVTAASSGLVEQLASLRAEPQPDICLAREPIGDLAAAARELAGPLAALAGKDVHLEVECLPCPGRVHLSHQELTRILINLTRNAAEAMPQGGRIRVTLQQGNGGNFFDGEAASSLLRTALLCVQDSGPGIPDAIQSRLFQTGFSTKPYMGVERGLGLGIVRTLAEAAGGRVRFFSKPGYGARFEVELPLIACMAHGDGFLADFKEKEHVQC